MPQITHTEGKSNSSEARKTWLKEAIRPKSLPLMKRDADVFLHQGSIRVLYANPLVLVAQWR